MSRPRILAQSCDLSRIGTLLDLFASEVRYAYLDSETRIIFTSNTDPLVRARIARWTNGRLFGERLEIRWQRDDLVFACQLLTESEGEVELALRSGWMPTLLDPDLDETAILVTHALAGMNIRGLPATHSLYNERGGAWFDPDRAILWNYPIPAGAEWSEAARLGLRSIYYTKRGYPVITRSVGLVML